jgi:formylglycine-generating enzyme required for sulfatase activity
MNETMTIFGHELRNGAIGLFYYAGHAIQVDGHNYLLPVDNTIDTEADVRHMAVDAGRVLGKMEDAGNELNIIILDACRNNPFPLSFRNAEQGLAKMDAPAGVMVAYSSAPGSVAADGEGRNGLYTQYLLQQMAKPGLKIEEVFKQVRIAVAQETGKAQVPWVSSSLVSNFYFHFDTVVVQSPAAVSVPAPGQNDFDALLWWSIKKSMNPADYQYYLRRDPNGTFADLVALRLDELSGSRQSAVPSAAASPTCSSVVPNTAQAGEIWKEPTTGMEFVYIPGGCYLMGCGIFFSLVVCFSDEQPVHEVCVDGFWLGRYEVTQTQYQAITGTNPSGFAKGGNYPVDRVSLDDAQSFIGQLNSRSGKTFRLPTEAEWEYAARSGGKDVGGNMCAGVWDVWNDENSCDMIHPVGQNQANGLGLYDMSGNVWEQCSDWYRADYYASSPRSNPQGPSSGSERVLRGGCWGGIPRSLRQANRRTSFSLRNDYHGLRLALSQGSE